MKTIEVPLTRGYVALIDEVDADRVLTLRWYVMVNKNTAYARRSLNWTGGKRPSQLLHRFVLGVTDPGVHVDHIDGNGLNNRRENLRECTRTQNLGNSKRAVNNRTGFKGVMHHERHGRYYARICVNGKQTYLGNFGTADEAHEAYCMAATVHFGAFARFE